MNPSGETQGATLFYARTDELADDPRAWAWMDEDERSRHERYIFEHSKREFRAAHALVREALSRACPAVAPARWRFEKNEYGRPSVHSTHGLHALRFNLSHTDGMLCVLVAWGREVGADVEDASRSRKTVEVADRFFAPREVRALRALPDARQVQRFFAYWTLKESYIKARGMGLALPLDGFSFDIDEGDGEGEGEEARVERVERGEPAVLADRVTLSCDAVVGDRGERWAFTRVRLSERHVGAVAIERDREGEGAWGKAPDVSLVRV